MARSLQPKREIRELSTLLSISRALEQSFELENVVKDVLGILAKHMSMAHGTLMLIDRESGEFWIEEAHGLSPAEKRRGRYKPGEGYTGRVIQSGRPVVIPYASGDPLFLDRTGARKRLKKREISFICVPIKLGKEVIGTLSADRLFPARVSVDEDLRLLTIVASMIAQGVRLRKDAIERQTHLMEENARLQDSLRDRYRPTNIIGNDKAMHVVYDHIAHVAESPTTVMVRGESGTGKELVAQAIHYSSPRSKAPFIRVNCAALPQTTIESELFGHERGAFTGAVQTRKGRFELASGGTIFLDEVGDLPPAIQVKLLRVLQEREFERVGGTKTLTANVRVITATNRDLEAMTRDGRFRDDLYYRLNVFEIHVPPLRQRKSDILLLANHFAERCGRTNGKTIRRLSTSAIDMLMAYHWPGNVRELENCMERAVLLSQGGVVHGHHLPPTLQTAEASNTPPVGDLHTALQALEREMLSDTLKTCRGNQAKAARMLGLTERIMGLRVRKYGLDPRRFRAG